MLALGRRRRCQICGGPAWLAAASWMHAHLRCRACGLLFVADLPSHADLVAAYRRVHESCYEVSHKARWEPWLEHKRRTLDALGLAPPAAAAAGAAAAAVASAGRGIGDLAEARAGAPARALDVGCGEGRLLIVLAERGWEAFGLEINPVLAAEARGLGLDVLETSIELAQAHPALPGRLPLDLVVMCHVIEHLRQPLPALRQIRGWLRPGGRLLVETPLMPDFANIDHLYCFSATALDLALREAGFRPRRWLDYIDANYGHHNVACQAERVW